MATKTVPAGVLLVVHFAVAGAAGPSWINADEFASSSYGVQIARRPISVEQHYDSSRVLIMSSKVGQEYRCSLPLIEPVLDQAATGSDGGEADSSSMTVVELLKPMESAPCLIKTKDWWTYEFCYGKEIRQFHLHNGQIQGDVISLGIYQSDFEWTLAEQEKAKKSRLSRYHSQQYVNGTKCDLTGSLRKTEVRFYCGEGDVDRITAIAESQTCMYTLHITTAKICSSIYLRLPNRPRPLTINCDPVVTEADYQEFLRQEAEEKENELTEKASATAAAATTGADASKDRIATFQQMLRATVEKQFGFDLGDFEMHFVDDGNSLEQVMDEVMKQSSQPQQPGSVDKSMAVDVLQPVNPVQPDDTVAQALQIQKPHPDAPVEKSNLVHTESVADARQGTEPSAGDGVHPEETDEMRQLREEITNLGVDADALAKYKDNIEHAVGSKFADILEEALQELRHEGVANDDIDKEAAYKHMAASLASLLDGMGQQKDRAAPPAAPGSKTGSSANAAAVEQGEAPASPAETPMPAAALAQKEAAPAASIVTVRIEPKVEVKLVDATDESSDAANAVNEAESAESTVSSGSTALPDGRRSRTVVAILQPAGRDARKEEARQREMEENYNHLWGKKRKVEL